MGDTIIYNQEIVMGYVKYVKKFQQEVVETDAVMVKALKSDYVWKDEYYVKTVNTHNEIQKRFNVVLESLTKIIKYLNTQNERFMTEYLQRSSYEKVAIDNIQIPITRYELSSTSNEVEVSVDKIGLFLKSYVEYIQRIQAMIIDLKKHNDSFTVGFKTGETRKILEVLDQNINDINKLLKDLFDFGAYINQRRNKLIEISGTGLR